MAEGFEAYHVPQQSRRDRLRVSDCVALLPFYNDPPSLLTIPSDLEKGLHLMDPQSSFQEINPNPFLYNPHQNLRFLDHSSPFHNMLYKQELSSAHEANIISNNDNNNNSSSSLNNVTTGQGLSLSLSSHNPHQRSSNSSSVPLELNLQRYDSSIFSTDMSSKSSSTILGPFTGYATILKGSRFLKPAQQLMDEVFDVDRGIYSEKLLAAGDDDSLVVMDPSTDTPPIGDDDGSEHRKNKSKLISMLDEVYGRYKQYYQQLQRVVASFESVPGLGNAAPFTNLSLKALSKHFRCLKNAITDQLNYTIKSHRQINCDDSTSTRSVGKGSLYSYNCQRAAIHNAGFVEHHQPVWRPQRGLPERAVTVLRAWLFDHFLHPYPTDSDKVTLAKQTGLSRNQVSNWFINARVRLWKPMVEEIHMLETRQAHKSASQRQGQNNNNNPIEHFPTSNNSLPSTSAQQFQQVPSKRTRNNDPADQVNLSYDNFSSHSRVGVDQMSASSGGNGGVSLTLGLHQNNSGIGIAGLSEPFPRNAARRFGIDANNEGFLFGGGFEAQNRQLGRDHNIIGGQLLHDFVG
ncbi:BEL1-like homeodomain protein 9 [Lycium ferocissimum]|uniref:BEL1-like homeodomain protein 9 n=1 Tax=Lycium ferocissimum TaxID=112874 RepID=UPI0028158C87|nr:BEL1-like homeodomain protein 9 [Lycium ferocissimum]